MTACVHHWLVEPSSGPVSWGECRRCHLKRQFKNSMSASELEKADLNRRLVVARAARKSKNDDMP